MRAVDLIWSGGEHPFALDIGGLRAVQDATGRGPMEIFSALGNGSWRVDDVLAVLRHGLIGGGMAGAEARQLVLQAAETSSFLKLAFSAQCVISDALMGPVDDPVGQPSGEQVGAAAPPVG